MFNFLFIYAVTQIFITLFHYSMKKVFHKLLSNTSSSNIDNKNKLYLFSKEVSILDWSKFSFAIIGIHLIC